MSERWMNLPRGVLLLSLVSWGLLGAAGPLASPTVRAQEIDCNDEANFKDWDCVQKRQAAQQAEPAGAPPPPEGAPSDAPPPPDTVAKAGDPAAIIFTLEDAGKEATQFLAEQGTDSRGGWARSRFERARDLSASRLGPNVIDTRAWVAKDVEAAVAIFKEQAAIKNFPERTGAEKITGPNERFKYENVAEETSGVSSYFEDGNGAIWHHDRLVVRKGKNVAVLYLFGRADGRNEENNILTNGLVDWFARKLAGRL